MEYGLIPLRHFVKQCDYEEDWKPQWTRRKKKGIKINRFLMSRDARKLFSGVPTRSDTNRHIQSQKQARSLKFRI